MAANTIGRGAVMSFYSALSIFQPNPRSPHRARGTILIFMTVAFVTLVAFISLGVDLGRVQLCKTELQRAGDAAARYGALALKNILVNTSAAKANALLAAADNKADGTPVILDPNLDIDLGIWTSVTRTFVVVTDPTAANAVRVRARRLASRGNAVPTIFAKLLGISYCDVTTTSIAMYTPGSAATYTVPATRNPFLSGEPAGTLASQNNPHNSPDRAGTTSNPRQSPVQCTLPITPGTSMSFDGINGSANHGNTTTLYDADGETDNINSNLNGSEHGMSDMTAPLTALVGVYLSDTLPDLSPAPPTLDFSTSAARDFTTLSPKLQQIFFIGDGRNSDGEVQQFQVPQGATRLYVAVWDAWEWNNNSGTLGMTIHGSGTVTLVK